MSIMEGILPNKRGKCLSYNKVRVTVSDVQRPADMPVTITLDLSIPAEMARFIILLQAYNCVTQLVGTVGAQKQGVELDADYWLAFTAERCRAAYDLLRNETLDD